jgi:hypothetical protein
MIFSMIKLKPIISNTDAAKDKKKIKSRYKHEINLIQLISIQKRVFLR